MILFINQVLIQNNYKMNLEKFKINIYKKLEQNYKNGNNVNLNFILKLVIKVIKENKNHINHLIVKQIIFI